VREQRVPLEPARLTTPRAAAVAGIAFSLLLGTSFVLIRIAIPADIRDSGEWLDERVGMVNLAIGLVPFAGIAFLWFIGVIRDRLGELEDRFFSSVLFGSGLLFLAMTFFTTTLAGGLLATYEALPQATIDSGIYTFDRNVMYRATNIFAIRMAAVFMMSAGTIWLRSRTMPRWVVVLTYALAVTQLVSISYNLWMALVFPAWTLVVSIYFLVTNPQIGQTRA
jgi:hypothetical protein